MALFVGGLAQLLAGMWEFACGNTFGATGELDSSLSLSPCCRRGRQFLTAKLLSRFALTAHDDCLIGVRGVTRLLDLVPRIKRYFPAYPQRLMRVFFCSVLVVWRFLALVRDRLHPRLWNHSRVRGCPTRRDQQRIGHLLDDMDGPRFVH